ncbi:MAG: hypothetical protein ACPG69_00765 [Candidatus Pseudothioglobus sp.]
MKNEQKNHNLDSENFEILDNFERFDQKNDVFRRSWWDQKIKSKKTVNAKNPLIGGRQIEKIINY